MLSYTIRVIPFGITLKEHPDVILASSPHPFAGLAGYILAKLKRARFIFEVMDLWPQVFVEIGGYSSKSLIVKLLRVLEKFLYRRARKTIVLMPKASEYITGLGIPGDKIAHIPLGADPELFSNPRVDLPQELNQLLASLQSEGRISVGYAGAHGIHDSLDTIIEAARLLQNEGADKVHFLLVGKGSEKQRVVENAKSLGLSNISFCRPIPKNAMPALLRAIDIAMMCRKKTELYKYGMSTNKLWEYMICARPIVWAIDSANDPVAEADCGITVPPEEPEELAKAIMQLCDLSNKERREMGMRGYDYVIKYHSVPVLADKLLEVIEDTKSA